MDAQSIQNTIQILLSKADQLNQSGQPLLAVKMLSKGIEHAPHDQTLQYALAEILIQNENFQDALSTLEKLAKKDFDPRLALMQCSCLEGLARFQEAEDLVDRVIAAEERSAAALNLKGNLLYRKNKTQSAKQCFVEALQIDPFNGRVSRNLGLLKLEKGQTNSAFADLEQAFDLAPQVKEIAETFHDIVSELGLFTYAEPMFRNACRRFPHNKRLAYLLIDLLIQQNKSREAMEKIENALAIFGIEDGILEPALKIRSSLGSIQVDGRKGTVSLCMIVKNEETHLAKCLASVKAIVDEIVVVDTGSSDRSRDIATVFGATVFTWDWRDDFAQARNYALSKANGGWIIILDADEVIAECDYEFITTCTNHDQNKNCAYSFITRNYTHDVGVEGWQANDGEYRQEAAGSGWYPSEKVRLFPNDDRFRFENAVHELVEPSLRRAGLTIKKCPVPVHHYGELSRQITGDKKKRYYTLGKKKIAAQQSGPAALIEHAIQAQEVGAHEEALDLWQTISKRWPDLAKAYFNMSYCYIQLERYSQGLRTAAKALELDPALKEAVLNRALCQIRIGKLGPAVASLEKLLSDTPGHPMATGLLAIANCIGGNSEPGIERFDELSKLGFNCPEYIGDHVRKLISAGRRPDAVSILEGVAESRHADEKIRSMLDELNHFQVVSAPHRVRFFDLNGIGQQYQDHLSTIEEFRNLDEKYFSTVSDEKQADFIFFPYDIDRLYHHLGYDGLRRFLEQLPFFKKHEFKFVFFLMDDISPRFDLGSVIYRVNHDKRKQDKNSITLPYFIDDLFLAPLADPPHYHANFVGTIVTHVLRAYMLLPFLNQERLPVYDALLDKLNNLLANRKNSQKYAAAMADTVSLAGQLFPQAPSLQGRRYYLNISVEQFHHLPQPIRQDKSAEFQQIMSQSVATLCPRGVGVQSIRFFETLCAGRIPLLISDHYVLPLKNLIDYSSFTWRVDEGSVGNLPEQVNTFFNRYTPDDLIQKAQLAREAWESYLAPSKRSKFFHLTLSEVLAANYRLNSV